MMSHDQTITDHGPCPQVESLIDDLRDGVRLLALLEVLSGERLPMERGRVLRRPHYLSNINTALEFLRGKRVSGENIKFTDACFILHAHVSVI